MDLNLLGEVFTDYHLVDVGVAAFQLEIDWFIRQDLVIRDAPAGGGNLLVEGVDYTLSVESVDETGAGYTIPGYSTRVTAAVGAGRNVYHYIAVINAAYQAGDLYFSGKYVGDQAEAADINDLLYNLRPKGHLFGLTLSNNAGDAVNDIDIAVGEAVDNADEQLMVLDSALTKRLDAAWAVGTNQGGLFSGAIADTTYYVYLIKRIDTGVVDAGFSVSAICADIPADYTHYRRIGYITRVAGAIRLFAQYGDRFVYKALVSDRAIAAIPNTNRNLQTLSVPLNTVAMLEVIYAGAAGNPVAWIRPTTYTDAAASATNRTVTATVAATGALEMHVDADAVSQIAYRGDSVNLSLAFLTAGYIDTRGRD
jgi:hypothetical protein